VLYAGCKVESGKRHALSRRLCILTRICSSHRFRKCARVGLSSRTVGIAAARRRERPGPPTVQFPAALSGAHRGVCNVMPPSYVVTPTGKEILCHHSDERLRQLRDPPRVVGHQPAAENVK